MNQVQEEINYQQRNSQVVWEKQQLQHHQWEHLLPSPLFYNVK